MALYSRRLRAAGDSRDREGEALGRLRRRTPMRACAQAKVRVVSVTEGSEARWWCGDVAVLQLAPRRGIVQGHDEVRQQRSAKARRSLDR